MIILKAQTRGEMDVVGRTVSALCKYLNYLRRMLRDTISARLFDWTFSIFQIIITDSHPRNIKPQNKISATMCHITNTRSGSIGQHPDKALKGPESPHSLHCTPNTHNRSIPLSLPRIIHVLPLTISETSRILMSDGKNVHPSRVSTAQADGRVHPDFGFRILFRRFGYDPQNFPTLDSGVWTHTPASVLRSSLSMAIGWSEPLEAILDCLLHVDWFISYKSPLDY